MNDIPSSNETGIAVRSALGRLKIHDSRLRGVVDEIVRLCSAARVIGEDGNHTIKLIAPEKEKLDHKKREAIARKLGSINEDGREEFIALLRGDPVLKAVGSLARKIRPKEDYAEHTDKKINNFRRGVNRFLKQDGNIPVTIKLRLRRIAQSIPELMEESSETPQKINGNAHLLAAKVFSNEVQKYFNQMTDEELEEIQKAVGRNPQNMWSSFVIHALEKRKMQHTRMVPLPCKEAEMPIIFGGISGVFSPSGDRTMLDGGLLMQAYHAMKDDKEFERSLREMLQVCADNDLTTSPDFQKRSLELRRIAQTLPAEIQPIFADIRKKGEEIALSLIDRLDPFVIDAMKTPHKPVAKGGCEPVLREYAHIQAMGFISEQECITLCREAKIVFPGLAQDVAGLVRIAVEGGLFLRSLIRRQPDLFADIEEDETPEQVIYSCKRKQEFIRQTLETLSPMVGADEGLDDNTEIDTVRRRRLSNMLADLGNIMNLHEYSLQFKIPHKARQVGPELLKDAAVPVTVSSCSVREHQDERTYEHMVQAVYTPSFGPQVSVNMSLRNKKHPDAPTSGIWMWGPDGEPCHAVDALVPLHKLLPEGSAAVRTARWMAHTGQNLLGCWENNCESRGWTAHFPDIAEHTDPMTLAYWDFESEAGKESFSGFLLGDAHKALLEGQRDVEEVDRKDLKQFSEMPLYLPAGNLRFVPIQMTSNLRDEIVDNEEDDARRVVEALKRYSQKNLYPLAEALKIMEVAGVFLDKDSRKGNSPHYKYRKINGGSRSAESAPLKNGEIYRTVIADIIAETGGDVEALEKWVDAQKCTRRS